MNRIINILIAFVFLVSFVGIQINKHYSHGKLYSVAFYHDAKSCHNDNGKCETENVPDNHCKNQKQPDSSCKDETGILKINNLFNKEDISLNPVFHTLSAIIPNLCLVRGICPGIFKNTFFFSSLPSLQQDAQAEFGRYLC